MIFVKDFDQFVNEGAFLDEDGHVILSIANDPKNPDEVLKTTGVESKGKIHGRSFFTKTPLSGRDPSHLMFPKFHSFDTESYTGPVDHPGRFKYTMDQLKNGNIVDAETALPMFITSSFKKLGVIPNFEPSYLVATGSTKGLVGKLCDAVQIALGKELPVVSLSKVRYLNAGDALDWDEVQTQMTRQASLINPEGIKTLNLVKTDLLHYIDKKNSNPELIVAITNATSVEELERIITGKGRYVSADTEISWLINIDHEKMIPFIIRSSGRNFQGMKSFWKVKYNYQEEQFINAVIDCITSLNRETKKRMLIVDDNINTGDDVRRTKADIEAIINKMIPDDPTKRNAAKSLFGFYVLYNMGKSNNLEYTIAGEIGSDGKAVKHTKYPVSDKVRDDFALRNNLPKL